MIGWLAMAREASCLTQDQCAKEIRLSLDEYRELEEHPGRITVNELSRLLRLMTPEGRKIVRDRLVGMMR